MPDLEELFATLAAQPRAALDLDVVLARGRQLTRRRRAAGAGALAVVLALIALVVPRALSQAGRASLVPATRTSATPHPVQHRAVGIVGPAEQTLPPRIGPRSTTATTPTLTPLEHAGVPARHGAVRGRPSSSVRTSAPAGGSSSGSWCWATTCSSGPSTDPGAVVVGSASYPAARSCSVDARSIAPGTSQRCRFTATVAGGWAITSQGSAGLDGPFIEVTITHDGTTTRHGPTVDATHCGTALIVPGDRVEVFYTQNSTDYELIEVGAGQGWSC